MHSYNETMPKLLAAVAAASLLSFVAYATALPPSGDAASEALAESPRHGESVAVPRGDGESPIVTYVAYPERAEKAPVVIVIHEIFGQSDWIRGVADALAAEGYIAVAPDMLSGTGPDGGGTDSFDGGEVREAIRKLTPEMVADRLDSVREYATNLPAASGSVGVVGFCWGGSQSFNYATHVAEGDLQAAVVYYGTAPSDGLDNVAVPVLGLYGGDDARVTSTVETTKEQMEALGKSFETNVYDGAGHGFLRQQDGRDGANATAAEQAWAATLAFFKENLE